MHHFRDTLKLATNKLGVFTTAFSKQSDQYEKLDIWMEKAQKVCQEINDIEKTIENEKKLQKELEKLTK